MDQSWSLSYMEVFMEISCDDREVDELGFMEWPQISCEANLLLGFI